MQNIAFLLYYTHPFHREARLEFHASISDLYPTCDFTFVGVRFDLVRGLLFPHLGCFLSIHTLVHHALTVPSLSVREWQAMIGLLSSPTDQVHLGRLHVRLIQLMSAEAEQAGKFWLNNLWQQYIEGVAKHRGLIANSLQKSIDELPDQIERVDGDFAQYAVNLGLVDRLMTAPEARQELARQGS